MKIILSSDVELWSWRNNFETNIKQGVLKLIELAKNEKIPITLFISLSNKGYNEIDYLQNITKFVKTINYKDVEFGTHTHCKNLPIEYSNKSDNLKDYSKEEIIQILKWYKMELEKMTKQKIIVHRAGSYMIPKLEILNECFKNAGLKIDSSDLNSEYGIITKLSNITEVPPGTSKEYSKKLRVFSPEQMTLKEMISFYRKCKNHGTRILVINFHSFSIYGSLGKKALLWQKSPKVIRNIVKPIINAIKQKNREKGLVNVNKEPAITKNFNNLLNLIKILKNDYCEFVKFEDIKNDKYL
jgi:hypothetical protein